MNRTIALVDGCAYHVFNRGNRKQRIFEDSLDYSVFIEKLRFGSKRYGVHLIAFCLMPNHFHAILRQGRGGSIPGLMNSAQTSAAVRYNMKNGTVGHLFQGHYKYVPLTTDDSILNVVRYVHMNPVVARLCKAPDEYPWSDFKDWLERAAEGVPSQKTCLDTGHPLSWTPKDYIASIRMLQKSLNRLDKVGKIL